MYIGLGIVLIVIGAILSFALEVNIPGISDNVLGYILILAGIVAIILSFAMRSRATGYTSTRSSHVDPSTGSRVEETRVDPDNHRY